MALPVQIVGEGIDWPAWVQAVGSVLAILVAIGLMVLERRRTNRENRSARSEFVLLAIGLVRQAEDLISDIEKGFSVGKLTIDPGSFNDVCSTLDRLPLERMPSAEFVLAYVNVRRSLASYGAGYEAALRLHGTSAGRKQLDAGLETHLFNAGRAVKLQVERVVEEGARLGVKLEYRRTSDIDANIKNLKRQMHGL
jgi:hypothetical protein